MKANELRIGNFIIKTGYHGKEIVSVDNIIEDYSGNELINAHSEADYDQSTTIVGEKLAECEPILITPEILVKASLRERYAKGEWSWANCKPEGEWDSYTELNETPDGYKYVGSYRPLKYVHQLQNLYFALTGEELNLQL